MTFIDGARITKRRNGAGWCALLSKQIILQLPRKRVQWKTVVAQSRRQAVPDCGTVEAEAPLAGWRQHSWQLHASSRLFVQRTVSEMARTTCRQNYVFAPSSRPTSGIKRTPTSQSPSKQRKTRKIRSLLLIPRDVSETVQYIQYGP